jgi:predicted Zn-dependent protease with MMP-like domain
MIPARRVSPRWLHAQQIVSRTLASLPEPLRQAATACPIELTEMKQSLREDPSLEPDLLGLFEGASRQDHDPEVPADLPRIRLFLDNLWDYAEQHTPTYREEVRITLLHELGHYLGLDEAAVERLGLA